MGLFSDQALKKLQQIAETIFTKSDASDGKDRVAPPPKLSGISPATGPAAGGILVTITGNNFNPGLKINFGGVTAAVGVLTKTTIAVTTPIHAPGAVDVEVVNPDGRNDVLRGAFTYA